MSKDAWGTGNVYLRGNRWWIHYSINGTGFRESSGSANRADAVRLLKKRIGESQQGAVAPQTRNVTLNDLLDIVKRDYAINKPKSSWWAELVIDKHLRPFFGYQKAARVGSALVEQYIDRRLALGRQNSTINRELAILRRAFRMALDHEPPLIARMPRIVELEESNVRTGFFEHADYLKLLPALPPEVQPLLTFGYYTGCRRGEILRLKWSQVDLTRRVVRLNPGETKNDQGRVIPLVAELAECLTQAKAERDENWPTCPWVFSRQGAPIRNFRAAWNSACASVGLASTLFHDLRRTGVRNLIRAGVPEKVAMAISGHKTRSVFDRYNIVTEDDITEAAARLERHIKRGSGADGEGRTPKPLRAHGPEPCASATSATSAKPSRKLHKKRASST